MKDVFVQAMREPFDLAAMLGRIDYHHIRGNLTDGEREELAALAREKADPFGGLDVAKKLQELDARVTALEKGGGEEPEDIPEYVPGKWYYAGDKVMFEGAAYVCTAPEDVVCVWSPAEYPAYWKLITEGSEEA